MNQAPSPLANMHDIIEPNSAVSWWHLSPLGYGAVGALILLLAAALWWLIKRHQQQKVAKQAINQLKQLNLASQAHQCHQLVKFAAIHYLGRRQVNGMDFASWQQFLQQRTQGDVALLFAHYSPTPINEAQFLALKQTSCELIQSFARTGRGIS